MSKKKVVGGYKTPPSLMDRRKQMKYSVSTASTTARGVIPIRGATKYPAEPTISFTREAWVKQCYLVDTCQKEVGWFALVDHDAEANSFTITEIVIPKQEVTSAETDIGKEDLADAAMELIEAGKDTGKMYAWFHSHVNMGVSPSTQDEFQVEDFLEDLADQPEVPAFIRGIQNKKGDLKLDIYYIQYGIAYQNLSFSVIHDDDPAWYDEIDVLVKERVTERTYKQYNNYSPGYGGGYKAPAKIKSVGTGAVADANGKYDDEFDYYGDIYSGGFRGPKKTQAAIYDAEDNDYIAARAVGTDVGDDDLDEQEAVSLEELAEEAYATMDIVYSYLPLDLDVLLDKEGQLWVMDTYGELSSYDNYTEKNGEIGESMHFTAVQ